MIMAASSPLLLQLLLSSKCDQIILPDFGNSEICCVMNLLYSGKWVKTEPESINFNNKAASSIGPSSKTISWWGRWQKFSWLFIFTRTSFPRTTTKLSRSFLKRLVITKQKKLVVRVKVLSNQNSGHLVPWQRTQAAQTNI